MNPEFKGNSALLYKPNVNRTGLLVTSRHHKSNNEKSTGQPQYVHFFHTELDRSKKQTLNTAVKQAKLYLVCMWIVAFRGEKKHSSIHLCTYKLQIATTTFLHPKLPK